MKKILRNQLILCFALLATVLLFFNNCGQELESASLAQLSSPEVKETYSKVVQSRYSPEACQEIQSYACDFHNYGSQRDDNFPDEDCLDIPNSDDCITVNTINIDTTEAVSNCEDCSDEYLEEHFFQKNFQCYHKEIMVNGKKPIRASAKTIESVALLLQENCHSFFKEGP